MNTHRLQVRWAVLRGSGGALAAAVLALAAAACTRTMSLGAAGMPDGSDVQRSKDGGTQPDVQPDRAPDVAMDAAPDIVADSAPDVHEDAHVDQNGDGGKSCVDNGITYHSGDVVLRPGCQLSCICSDGVVGACSGIPCSVDGSIAIDPALVVIIDMGDPTSPEAEVVVDNRGAAERNIGGPTPTFPTPPLPRTFPPGAPEVTQFLYHLQRVGDLTKVTAACPTSLTNSIVMRLPPSNNVVSGNYVCPIMDSTPDKVAFIHDIRVLLGLDDGNDSINAQSCTANGGQISNNLCCTGAGNFADSCGVGACSCAPTDLKVVDTCVCPTGSCFLQEVGCVGPANVCTVGADQTCNDSPAVNAFHGTCVTGGRCRCHTGFTVVAASGKCS